MIYVVLLDGNCVAQQVDVPTGRGRGSLVAPTGWAELIVPVQKRVDLKLCGVYIGELKAPSAQVDATFRVGKKLESHAGTGDPPRRLPRKWWLLDLAPPAPTRQSKLCRPVAGWSTATLAMLFTQSAE
jgi:hypothetical protein